MFPVLLSAAVDRSVSASLSDARDAMTNAAMDSLMSYRQSVLTIQQPGLLAPACLRLFPLYILALLKQVGFVFVYIHRSVNSKGSVFESSAPTRASGVVARCIRPLLIQFCACVCVIQKAFRTGTSTRLDDRVFAMCQLKYQPLAYTMLMIHPALYRVDDLSDEVRKIGLCEETCERKTQIVD